MKKLFLSFLVTIIIIAVFNPIQSIKKVQAASTAVTSAIAKIDHLTWSLKNNYLGIKNQAQWEIYIKEARNLIKIIPSSEYSERDKLIVRVDKAESLVNSVARINQVEKSMEKNFHGIKNADQWNKYIELGRSDLSKVDKNAFRKEYENLIGRMEKCKEVILSIEEEFEKEYSKALALYTGARESMFLKNANEALETALLLGTCNKSDELEKKCRNLINEIKTLTIDIKSLSTKSDTYDNDRKNQSIPLIVNDEVISIGFLKVAGYDVSFEAENIHGDNSEIFRSGSTSNTGLLKDKLIKGEYLVTVTLTKGEGRFISDATKISIINLDFSVSGIKAYTIKNLLEDGNDFIQNSNTLVVGERASISSLTVLIGDETCKVSRDIVVRSNNNNIVAIENNTLRAKSKGKAVVTAYYNGASKDIDIEVKEEGRKVETVDTKDLELIVGKSLSSKIKLSDQYNDPIDYRDISISIQGINQVQSATIEYKNPSEGNIKVKAGNTEGLGAIHLRDRENRLLKTIQVSVSKINNVEHLSMDIVPMENKEYSSDNVIFESSSYSDKYIKYKISKYNSEGIHNGYVNLNGYRIIYDKELLSITGQENGVFEDTKSFTISGKRVGESDIAIFYPNNTLAVRSKVKVLPSGNNITSIKWRDTKNINYIGENINIHSAISMVESSNDDIVKDIGLEFSTPYKVRVVKNDYTKKSGVDTGTFYIDKDGNGRYNEGDISIGKITSKCIDLSNNSESKPINIYQGITTKRGDDLIIIYTVTNQKGEILDTLSIKVLVK